ncbi:NADH-quinone oxidoreductase subunit NuoN [uncultured Propionivibrio sp.]|uniref:NADH-quinone oxidoreductase subunit NuoN n=1 Tax=uncultured Propionivibrio sp. TaxID=426737 RepID=UPI0029C02134|nr:NADH-quinone oxidoreductase subunit NuoN [uncultured Propionivibrio sp.]
MQFALPDLRLASAEIFLLAMACLIMIVDLFVRDKNRTLTFVLTQFTLAASAVVTVMVSSGQVAYTFSNMYVGDLMGDLLKLMLDIVMIVVLFYSRGYVLDRPQLAKGEFYTLTLFATLGMMVMISANHFLTIYIGIELLSLSLYGMVALNRDSVQATEAAMKYFVLGALASGLLLYGMSMIYGATGSLEITTVAERLFSGQADMIVLLFGVVFLVAGIAFKLGVVPFHMWIPDVYHGAPTAVTLIIASAPKLAAFAIVMRMLVGGLLVASNDWQNMLLILSVLSMAVGNFAAIAQTNLKRMLAYSAISHMGFMLLGLVVGVVGGDARFAINAYSSSMFYVMTYVITSAGTFGMILLLSRAGFESEEISDLAGLNKRSPWFAAVMMMMMFSMAGIPFFVGFFAKFSVLQAVVAAGYLWLAIAAVLFSLVGAYYYLRVVKVMYFDVPTDDAPITASLDVKVLMSFNGLAVAALGLFPQMLMSICAFVLLRSL